VDHQPENEAAGHSRVSSRVRTLIVCFLIIALGGVGASYINRSAPQARKRAPERTVALVQTLPLVPDSHQVVVTAMGSVIPAREVTLKARVPGEIRFKHTEFIEGGFIRAGETLLKIDAKDYELAIARKQSAVVDARYALGGNGPCSIRSSRMMFPTMNWPFANPTWPRPNRTWRLPVPILSRQN